jgi:hypothetical protein
MGKRWWALLLAMLVLAAGPAISLAGPGEPDKPAQGRVHPATTQAEKALDNLLRLSEKRSGLVDALLGRRAGKADLALAGQMTTPRLRRQLADLERWTVRENCKGRYIPGELCGLDYNPLTCAQDASDAPYSYRTLSSSADQAEIAYFWPGADSPLARFFMVAVAGTWKLDAVQCLP